MSAVRKRTPPLPPGSAVRPPMLSTEGASYYVHGWMRLDELHPTMHEGHAADGRRDREVVCDADLRKIVRKEEFADLRQAEPDLCLDQASHRLPLPFFSNRVFMMTTLTRSSRSQLSVLDSRTRHTFNATMRL